MKLNNKGFSLVEVLIAVAVSTIVFGAITALIVFASNSSRQTNARITLQNEAKDAVNHMEALYHRSAVCRMGQHERCIGIGERFGRCQRSENLQ